MTALVCLVVASGCYRTHDGEVACGLPIGHVCCEPSGTPRVAPSVCPFECPSGTRLLRSGACFAGSADAAPPRDTGPFFDAGPRADAGPAISCPEVRADFACLDSPVARAGEPFELSARFDTCGCCPDVACAVRAEPETGRLFLTTGLCAEPGDCFCDSCVTPRVDCPIPALEAGTWDVVVNGGEAFEIEVLDAPAPEVETCFSFAEPDRCLSTPSLEPRPLTTGAVCFERSGRADLRLRITEECGSCHQLRGPCVVGVEDLGEREHALIVAPFVTDTACDVDCPGACVETVRTCELPRVRFGDTYTLRVHGDDAGTFVLSRDEAPFCGAPTPPG